MGVIRLGDVLFIVLIIFVPIGYWLFIRYARSRGWIEIKKRTGGIRRTSYAVPADVKEDSYKGRISYVTYTVLESFNCPASIEGAGAISASSLATIPLKDLL